MTVGLHWVCPTPARLLLLSHRPLLWCRARQQQCCKGGGHLGRLGFGRGDSHHHHPPAPPRRLQPHAAGSHPLRRWPHGLLRQAQSMSASIDHASPHCSLNSLSGSHPRWVLKAEVSCPTGFGQRLLVLIKSSFKA